MADDRRAKLREIEDAARQQGHQFMLAQSARVASMVINGRVDEAANDAMMADTSAAQFRMSAEKRASGATGKEMKVYNRGLHAGMSAGLAEIFKPYVESSA